jgi:hypothetical protein
MGREVAGKGTSELFEPPDDRYPAKELDQLYRSFPADEGTNIYKSAAVDQRIVVETRKSH